MSKSLSSMKQQHVYVAIPIDVTAGAGSSTTRSIGVGTGATPAENHRLPPTSSSTTARAVACFTFGSVLGILFSVIGFWVQSAYKFDNIFAYSLAWSCLTSVLSYLIFYVMTSVVLRPATTSTKITSARSEYHFALGVFLGFCLACIVTDVFLQMPLRSILVTVAIAIAWACVMTYCGSLEDDEAEVECDVEVDGTTTPASITQALLIRERKGTVLPLVIV